MQRFQERVARSMQQINKNGLPDRVSDQCNNFRTGCQINKINGFQSSDFQLPDQRVARSKCQGPEQISAALWVGLIFTASEHTEQNGTQNDSFAAVPVPKENSEERVHEEDNFLPRFKSRRTPLPSHIDSSQICDVLNPPQGIRDVMQRKGIVPRNHLKDNRAAISELSAKIHAMKQMLSKSEEPTIPVPTSKSQGNLQTTERVDCINYLAKNFKEAAMPARRRTPKTETEPHKQKENFGKIPAYLIKRKIELAQEAEKRLQEEEAKSLPPGLVLMCDEEREKLMKTLEENKADIVRKLSALPLVVEIPSQVRAKSEMDFQLRETEEAIKRFSRPKVYISLNE